MKKIIKKICLPIVLMGASLIGQAQTTWYFGNLGGIRFNGGTTTPITGSLNTYEGSSVMVDQNNNVVMYCNGQKVWNGNHEEQSLALRGDPSSTQTAVIVPIPGTTTASPIESQAFIFTVNAVESNYGEGNFNLPGYNSGLRVTRVKIAGTAPFTTITELESNFNLIDDGALMSERLTATSDGKGGYWVLTHGVGTYSGAPSASTIINNIGERKFYAYHVTCSTTTTALLDGTQIVSDITNTGINPHQSFVHVAPTSSFPLGGPAWSNPINQFNGQGQMKFNRDGNRIALTMFWLGRNGNVVNPNVQLYRFNRDNGQVENSTAIEFNLGYNTSTGDLKDAGAYGVEFSPNGNLLYTSSSFGSSVLYSPTLGGTTRVYQYNISSWNKATIEQAANRNPVYSAAITTTSGGSTGALMIGPDNRIYVAKNNRTSIDVINSPDVWGVGCGYAANSVNVGGTCYSGLPTVVLTANSPATPTLTVNPCKGSISIASGFSGNAPDGYYWQVFGSDASGTPVTMSGMPTYASNSFYYSGLGTGASYIPGIPPATYPTDLNTVGICGKYYTSILYLKSECGSVTRIQTNIFQIKCPATPSLAVNPCKGNIAITSSYTGDTPESYYWQIFGSDAAGNPTTISGMPTYASNSFYYAALGTGSAFINGVPPASFTGDLNNVAICGRYYTSILYLKSSSCGTITKTITFQIKCSSTPTITANACKGSLSLTSGYTGIAPTSHYWQVFGSDANGNPITSGGSITYAGNSFYYNALGTGSAFVVGPPPATYPVNLNAALICDKYYTSILYLKSECDPTVAKTYTTTFKVKCNDPSFSMNSNTTNTAYFTLAATPNDIAAASNPGFGYAWFVEDLNASNVAIFTMSNLSNWWISSTATNDFKDFDHVANPGYVNTYTSLPIPSPAVPNGKFLYGHNYRITRGTWDAVCPWKQFSGTASYTPHKNPDGTTSMNVIFVEDKTAPDFSHVVQQIPTTIKTLDGQTDNLFVVYPNPSSGIFTVELNNDEKATMEVFDITGKVIKSIQLYKNDHYTLDLSGYAKGIYMIKMNGAQQQLQKIILE